MLPHQIETPAVSRCLSLRRAGELYVPQMRSLWKLMDLLQNIRIKAYSVTEDLFRISIFILFLFIANWF